MTKGRNKLIFKKKSEGIQNVFVSQPLHQSVQSAVNESD